MDELMDSIELIKTKIMDSEYMTIMDKMKIVHDTKDWNWISLVEIMTDEEIPDFLSDMAHMELNGYTCAELPLEMAVMLQKQAMIIRKLKSVISYQAVEMAEHDIHGQEKY